VNCIACSKKKGDYDVWTNKIIIGATYNSKFQDNGIIRSMSDKSVICHNCVQIVLNKVEGNLK
jgi:hypothetical protein